MDLRMSWNAVVLASVIATVAPAFGQLPEDLKRQFDEAEQRIVRLPPTAFPELPRNVVRELQRRGCSIPQEAFTKKPHNVITGQFARPGERDWAVLCSNIGYSRGISAVGKDFILQHFDAYGGPAPPPIDHHGIDDAFIEKGSATLYLHNGEWLKLSGSD
jgi:hypothetical protein